MQVLALSRRLPAATPAAMAALAQEEALAAHRLISRGVLRSAHMCPERPGAVLVLECTGLEEAREHLGTLPMVRAGLIDFDVSRMLPYTSYTALFKDDFRAEGSAR
ncbi:MAG TPA: hypothetical protein VEA40_08515 [Ramlibacter sp.]|nr:hypothetical protein [Ramlibacter sp.]